MDIQKLLSDRGYKGPVVDHYSPYSCYYYRKIPGTSHQLVVREYTLDHLNSIHKSYEVEMCYENVDSIWVNTKFYGINEEEILSKLPILEQSLYSAVESMGGDRLNYQGSEKKCSDSN